MVVLFAGAEVRKKQVFLLPGRLIDGCAEGWGGVQGLGSTLIPTLMLFPKVIGGELQDRLIPVPYSKSATDQAVRLFKLLETLFSLCPAPCAACYVVHITL